MRQSFLSAKLTATRFEGAGSRVKVSLFFHLISFFSFLFFQWEFIFVGHFFSFL